MKTVKGDLIELAKQGAFDIIIHGCNCFCSMSGGIARTIKQEFPLAFAADLKTTPGDKEKLGLYTSAKAKIRKGDLIIINAYTQYDFKGAGTLADYEAIRSVFKAIKTDFSGLRIGYPAIGAGLARGDWSLISKIITEELKGEDHTFVEYTR